MGEVLVVFVFVSDVEHEFFPLIAVDDVACLRFNLDFVEFSCFSTVVGDVFSLQGRQGE